LPFPARPETDDKCRSELLRLMGVAEYPGVYVLGCFARYVTVYAQQIRALNLVDSLAKAGFLSRYSRVAVVGGGIAGLTAAAAAAVRGVGHVQVFEKLDATMRLQRASEKRYLHPYIYDWPEIPEVGEGKVIRANLPLMDWKADRASDVIEELDGKWRECRERTGGRLQMPRCGCGAIEVGSASPGPFVRVQGEEPQPFDVVILAVGFGLDRNANTEGYWADTKIDSQEIERGQSWFVSGYGDGALTDLMRLCIRDFRHGRVLAAVDEHTRKVVGQELMDAERRLAPDRLAAAYLGAAKKIAPALDERLPPRGFGKIWLNCSETALFSPQSSILNRLITAYLYEKQRFQLLEGKIVTPVGKEGGRYKVLFEDKRDPWDGADEIIVRHGPDKALKRDFPALWDACQPVAAEWQAARQHEDWTRKPLYSEGEFDPGGKTVPPLRVHFGDQVGCVLLTGSFTPAGPNQKQLVGYALKRFQGRLGEVQFAGRSIDPEPEWIRAEDALASSAAYERAVRALCEAEIAVFDIAGLDPAVMLFLGIRAAVRRGITITLKEEGELLLPFNLVSLNPIAIRQEKGDAEGIAVAMESGWAALKAQPGTYLDLPVFDAIRHLGDDFRPKEPAKQILVLRWFDPQYNALVGDVLDNELKARFGRATSIVTTLDSRSPQLVEQRLYADIRRTKVCIADWTGWRPNVFFEIGVRLAVNETDPLFILCAEPPPGWKNRWKGKASRWPKSEHTSAAALAALAALESFFAPTRFSVQETERLSQRIEKLDPNAPSRGTGAKLSAGRTYRVVVDALNRRDEPGGRPVHELLTAEAQAMAGPAVPEKGDIPVLFPEALAGQVRRAALEYVLAAWYYLAGRYRLVERLKAGRLGQADVPLVKSLQQVGEDLRDRLYNPPAEYQALYDEVVDALERIEARQEAGHERRDPGGPAP
jgi:NAD(P)-binding Rossmann-like domain